MTEINDKEIYNKYVSTETKNHIEKCNEGYYILGTGLPYKFIVCIKCGFFEAINVMKIKRRSRLNEKK